MKFEQQTKEKIAKKLQEKGALKPCERCGQNNFTVLDGFVYIPLAQQLSGDIIIGGPQVPCAAVVCTNCGNISNHALGALGLLNELNKGG